MANSSTPALTDTWSALNAAPMWQSQDSMNAAIAADPMLQKIYDAGGISFGQLRPGTDDQQQGGIVNWDIASKILPTVNGAQVKPYGTGNVQPIETMAAGAPGSHITLDASGNPQISQSSYNTSSGAAQVGNPNAVTWDPNYGWVTPQGNVHTYNKSDVLDKLLSNVGPALIGTGLGAGFGALGAFADLPAGAGQIFNSTIGNLSSGKFNPISFIPGLSSMAGLPSWFGPLASLGASTATSGGSVNPLNVIMTLGRLAAMRGGNG